MRKPTGHVAFFARLGYKVYRQTSLHGPYMYAEMACATVGLEGGRSHYFMRLPYIYFNLDYAGVKDAGVLFKKAVEHANSQINHMWPDYWDFGRATKNVVYTLAFYSLYEKLGGYCYPYGCEWPGKPEIPYPHFLLPQDFWTATAHRGRYDLRWPEERPYFDVIFRGCKGPDAMKARYRELWTVIHKNVQEMYDSL